MRVNNYFSQWKADSTNRTKAMPHIKCSTRISPDLMQTPWFTLTSANLSLGAWGSEIKSHEGAALYITNYEAGVVFLPQFIVSTLIFV